MQVPLLVLNYNGRELLARCVPSLLRAAARSRYDCPVIVIDNESSDGSLSWLATRYPQVRRIRYRNVGLCAYNSVLSELQAPLAVLLNNDVVLDPEAIDPLVAPLVEDPACFLTSAICFRWDGRSYEGQRTSVRWRYGLVQATSHFPGHETGIHAPSRTASAGAVIAVDRQKFLELGGFDPLYLPGRLEDLDLAFRAFAAGCHCQHVPEAVAYHKGAGSFGPTFGQRGCDLLALRNTLLFQWKNLRHPAHILRQLAGLALRAARDVGRAPLVSSAERWAFFRAFTQAWKRRGMLGHPAWRAARSLARERLFFREFHPQRMLLAAPTLRTGREDRLQPDVLEVGVESEELTA